jgi:lysophospholipid acyltransferase (LPLAT)-like uncharacterized protein
MPLTRHRMIGLTLSLLVRLWARTLRIRFIDRSELGPERAAPPVIWCFWHNRILLMPWIYRRWFRQRLGTVITSPSTDGEVLAATLRWFGLEAVRGSSSRSGVRALVAARRAIVSGRDMAITPDGPRGPRYVLSPGVVRLSQLTGAPVLPFHIRFGRCIRLRSWDGFILPLPCSRVEVVAGPLHRVAPTPGDDAFEVERLRLESVLRADVQPE